MNVQTADYVMPTLRAAWYGPEKLCSKCGEYWPADEEFFFRETRRKGGLSAHCKACYYETPSVLKRRGRLQ